MDKFMKIVSVFSLSVIFLVIIYAAFNALNLGYMESNFIGGIGLIMLVTIIGIFFFYMGRNIWLSSVILLTIILESCNYAKSNQQVIVSEDCGVNWKKIESGKVVPKGGLNPCYMRVVIPNHPMQGEAIFITNLKDRVRATVHIDYDYNITNALAFIKQAKFLGKANTDPDDEEAIGKNFESAENAIIDKRIKDVAKNIFIEEDIVELDQSEIEEHLLNESNKILEPLGISLNFITLVFDLDEQTRQAIDISTAMKIYKSKNLEEIGKIVMGQRAGATKITVENKIDKD